MSPIEACAREIDCWMRANKLKLNIDRSELLMISSKYHPRPLLISTLGRVRLTLFRNKNKWSDELKRYV